MTRNADQIEQSLVIPTDVAEPVMKLVGEQDNARGPWRNPRDSDQPDAPWPEIDSAALGYLLHKFHASVKAGMDVETAALQLAVHAWFEGGVENYDRGQSDARTSAT